MKTSVFKPNNSTAVLDEATTAVYLSEHEALLFVKFQKHFAFMQLMESIGGFDIKDGSIEVHFDKIGQILKVEKHEHFRV